MSVRTDRSCEPYLRLRGDVHPHCVVCGAADGGGLGLRFAVQEDGSVTAEFQSDSRYQGFEDRMHGGIVSCLLDGAMTNCLFAHGIVAVTAELKVKFRHPIALDSPVDVRASITESRPPLHRVEGTVMQAGEVKAKSSGKFMEQ